MPEPASRLCGWPRALACLLLAGAGALCGPAVFGQAAATTAQPPLAATPAPTPAAAAGAASSVPATRLSDAQIAAALRAGGLVVYFRHALTDFSRDDRQMRDFDDCEHQRLLSPQGREMAAAIGRQWRRLNLPVGRVLASPFCRTRDTAERMFGRFERYDEVRGGPAQAAADRYDGLRQLFATPVEAGRDLVIVSHGNPFNAVAGPPYLREGEAALVRPLPPGRWEVIARVAPEDWARLR